MFFVWDNIVIIQCCLRRGLGLSSSSHGDHGGAGEGPVDGAVPCGDTDPVEPCWGSRCLLVLCLRNENDELKFNKSLNARQGHLKWELSLFD